MVGIVVVSLLVLAAATIGIAALMFLDVAFTGRGAAVSLSRPALDGASLAQRMEGTLSRLLNGRTAASAVCADACRQREILVSTPEALAIVQELRQSHTPAQVAAFRDLACENVACGRVSVCPLRMPDGSCASNSSRPIVCRTREAQRGVPFAERLGTGLSEVFSECLEASGVDATRYELNEALVRIMDDPQSGQRWASGERALASASA